MNPRHPKTNQKNKLKLSTIIAVAAAEHIRCLPDAPSAITLLLLLASSVNWMMMMKMKMRSFRGDL